MANSAVHDRAVLRPLPLAEIALFFGSIVVFIWFIEPTTGPTVHVTYYLLVALFAWLTARLHGDTPRSVGLRLDNFAASARLVLPLTALIAAGFMGAGAALGPAKPWHDALVSLAPSFVWALVQQYVLQAIVQRRLWDAGIRRRAPLVAAALFALAHAPNPGLMTMTFLAGWLWCSWYRRHENLLTLAFSHAVLAAVVLITMPPFITGHLRVGPGYFPR